MKCKRWVFCCDNHGQHAHAETLAAFWDFLGWWKPHIKIHGGDNWNFDGWRSRASAEDQAADLSTDFSAGIEFVRRYRPSVFLEGNHDYRREKMEVNIRGDLRFLANRMQEDINAVLTKCNTIRLPYCSDRGVYELGDYAALHGYAAGETSARRHANAYGNCLFGHVHTITECTVPSRRNPRTAHAVGCLCRLDMEYLRPTIGRLNHKNGWAYGLLFPSGKVAVCQAKRIDGVWVLPSEFRLSTRPQSS